MSGTDDPWAVELGRPLARGIAKGIREGGHETMKVHTGGGSVSDIGGVPSDVGALPHPTPLTLATPDEQRQLAAILVRHHVARPGHIMAGLTGPERARRVSDAWPRILRAIGRRHGIDPLTLAVGVVPQAIAQLRTSARVYVVPHDQRPDIPGVQWTLPRRAVEV